MRWPPVAEAVSAESLSVEAVSRLLVARIQQVLLRDDGIGPDSRFDADLHADSLDVVEIIEGVERDLAARGVRLELPDDVLLALGTVGEAARAIHAHARGGGHH